MLKQLKLTIFASAAYAALLFMTACSSPPATVPASRETETSAPQAPPTALAPTETPLALAAQVNGEPILLEDFQAELTRYEAGVGTELATEDQEIVLQEMVAEMLLAQAATQAGFVADDGVVQAHIDQLGISAEELADWMQNNHFTDESLRTALARSIAAAWMRDQIIGNVPQTTEQVHARQILLYNSDAADEVFAQLQAGADFETLSAQFDPLTKGDLDWFPRGYLTVPELDAFIFELEPGEFTPIIETMLGFHIVQVIERDAAHPLNPNTYRAMQAQALEQWLQDRQAQSQIILYVP